MKPLAYLCLALGLALSLICCSSSEKSQFFTLPGQCWPYGMSLQFIPDSTHADSAAIADIAVAIRHANTYEYSNIYVELQYATADTTVVDTVNIKLADDYGHWLGTGMGVGYQVVDTVARKVNLLMSQPITLRHIMRADTLPAIEQAGIIVH